MVNIYIICYQNNKAIIRKIIRKKLLLVKMFIGPSVHDGPINIFKNYFLRKNYFRQKLIAVISLS